MAQTGKQFPIQPDLRSKPDGYPGGFIPWAIAEQAYEQYVKLGHGSQSLERLAERHGFGWQELTQLLRGENPY